MPLKVLCSLMCSVVTHAIVVKLFNNTNRCTYYSVIGNINVLAYTKGWAYGGMGSLIRKFSITL